MVILYIQYKYTMQERSMQERNIEGFYDDYFLTPKVKRQKREEMYVETRPMKFLTNETEKEGKTILA